LEGIGSWSREWLFQSDRFRIVRAWDKEKPMPKERARADNIVEINNGDRKLKFKLERIGDSERIVLVEALDQVSSPLEQLLSVLNGRWGH